jgi:hypothetical protein
MASSGTPPPAGAAPPAGQEEGGQEQSIHSKANAKVPWPESVWEAMHRVIHDEIMRVELAHKFLRVHRVHPKTTSVPPDTIIDLPIPGDPVNNFTLTVDEGLSIRLNEFWAEFALTPQQVHETAEAKHPEHTTAVTLARRAAQYLALAQDMIVFQGSNAYNTPFFQQSIRFRPGQIPADQGLVGAASIGGTTISVPELSQNIPGTFGVTYGQNTFTQLVLGYSTLTDLGHPGDYAFALNTFPYADLYAPVGAGSLVVTADRCAPLVKAGLYGSGALPPNTMFTAPPSSPPALSPPYTGVLVDPVGDTMDLVVGLPATVIFMQQDPNDFWRFRVATRSALRLKDPTAVVVYTFD